MPTFNEELARLQGQNFVGGLVQAASAKLMSARFKGTQDTLSELNSRLNQIEDVPLTTDEQLDRLTQHPEGAEAIKSLEDTAAEYRTFQEKIAQRQAMYGAAYSEAMQKLTLIGGEEAFQAKQLLSMEKQEKLDRLIKQGQLPQEVLEYNNLVAQYSMSKEKFADYLDAKEKNKQMTAVEDYIINHPDFQGMEMNVDVYADTAYGRKVINDFKLRNAKLISDIKTNFPGLGDGVLNLTVTKMLGDHGKLPQQKQVSPREWAAISEMSRAEKRKLSEEQFKVTKLLNDQQAFSNYWISLPQEIKASVADDMLGRGRTYTDESLNALGMSKETYKGLLDKMEDFFENNEELKMLLGEQYWSPTKMYASDGSMIFAGTEGVYRFLDKSHFLNNQLFHDPEKWARDKGEYEKRYQNILNKPLAGGGARVPDQPNSNFTRIAPGTIGSMGMSAPPTMPFQDLFSGNPILDSLNAIGNQSVQEGK